MPGNTYIHVIHVRYRYDTVLEVHVEGCVCQHTTSHRQPKHEQSRIRYLSVFITEQYRTLLQRRHEGGRGRGGARTDFLALFKVWVGVVGGILSYRGWLVDDTTNMTLLIPSPKRRNKSSPQSSVVVSPDDEARVSNRKYFFCGAVPTADLGTQARLPKQSIVPPPRTTKNEGGGGVSYIKKAKK